MPELLDDDTLVTALRRYGTAVEAAARRAEPTTAMEPAHPQDVPLLDYPVASNAMVAPESEARGRRRPRRRVLAGLTAVAVFLVMVAVAVLVGRPDDRPPSVETPATTSTTGATTTSVAAAEPFADGTVLLWFPNTGPPQFLAQGADRPVPLELGDPPKAGAGGIATTSPTAGLLAGGTMFMLVRDGEVIPTDFAADRVLADRKAGVFYLYGSGVLSRFDPSKIDADGNRPDQASLPAWQVPAGWRLANGGNGVEVVDGRVILEGTDPSSGVQDIAAWIPATGELTPIGRAWWVVDATGFGVPQVAWVDGDCDVLAGCGLVITNLDVMESHTVARPEHGYIGGGAFSDDGRRLAAFVAGQENMGVNPSADLAVVDTATREMRVMPDTNVAIGESYGSAAWTLDGTSVIYHGLGPTRVIDIETGQQRTLPWDITYSMATIP